MPAIRDLNIADWAVWWLFETHSGQPGFGRGIAIATFLERPRGDSVSAAVINPRRARPALTRVNDDNLVQMDVLDGSSLAAPHAPRFCSITCRMVSSADSASSSPKRSDTHGSYYCPGCNAVFLAVDNTCPRCFAVARSVNHMATANTVLLPRGDGASSDVDAHRALDELVGATLHCYEIESLAGSGGMGHVYLARHGDLHRRCAVKILSPGLIERDEEFIERFQHEARAAASLSILTWSRRMRWVRNAASTSSKWNSFQAAHCKE